MVDEEDRPALQDLVRGRLSEEDAARLNREIEADSLRKVEYRLVAALNETDTAPHAFQADIGWARLSRAIKNESARRPWQRRIEVWHAAAGLMIAIFAWQLSIAPYLAGGPATSPRYTTASGEQPTADTRARLRLIFVPNTSEEAIRSLLQAVGAEIVAGPTALGFYTLAFESDDARDGAEQRLSDAGSVVQFVDPS